MKKIQPNLVGPFSCLARASGWLSAFSHARYGGNPCSQLQETTGFPDDSGGGDHQIIPVDFVGAMVVEGLEHHVLECGGPVDIGLGVDLGLLQLQHTKFKGIGDGFRPVGGFELLEDRFDVGLGGVLAH